MSVDILALVQQDCTGRALRSNPTHPCLDIVREVWGHGLKPWLSRLARMGPRLGMTGWSRTLAGVNGVGVSEEARGNRGQAAHRRRGGPAGHAGQVDFPPTTRLKVGSLPDNRFDGGPG